jgi:hypothetical protein
MWRRWGEWVNWAGSRRLGNVGLINLGVEGSKNHLKLSFSKVGIENRLIFAAAIEILFLRALRIA